MLLSFIEPLEDRDQSSSNQNQQVPFGKKFRTLNFILGIENLLITSNYHSGQGIIRKVREYLIVYIS